MNDTKLGPFLKLFDEEVISAIDVEFCRFLQEVSPDIEENVLLAACLTSMTYQNGDVCILLKDYAGESSFNEAPEYLQLMAPELELWVRSLQDSSVVGGAGDFRPLILDEAGRLYLHRLWNLEQSLAHQILERANRSAPEADLDLLKNGLNRLFGNTSDPDWQKIASTVAIHNLLTVISGGPGTGKTTTVVRFLVLLLEQGRERGFLPSIALAAPTGKAAARLKESVAESKTSLQTDEDIKASIPVDVVTIHQLMGARRHTAHFRYNEENPLPYDCIVIDEVSMVDQVLMSRLMNALRPETRLLILGDKDQLASVEAGSVLGDICGNINRNTFSPSLNKQLKKLNINLPGESVISEPLALTDNIILLNKSYRFSAQSGIGRLSRAINRGDADESWSLLIDPEYPEISVESINEYKNMEDVLFNPMVDRFEKIQSAQIPREIMKQYNAFKILAAHRKGPWGIKIINKRIEQLLKKQGLISPYDSWYEGRPVIINKNDYSLGLSNGDIGICMRDKTGFKVCFMDDKGIFKISPSRLPQHSTGFALTVHKSQGSEFDNVLLVLPDQLSPLISRELLYTAVTRARKQVKVLGTKKVIRGAINNYTKRNSGLNDNLWQDY